MNQVSAIYGLIKNILTLKFARSIIFNYYSKFKTEFNLENYLLRWNTVHRNYICKLRTSHIQFPIETGVG